MDKKLAALRKIVADSTSGRVDGKRVDLFSASAILAVYDKLDDANKAKFLGMNPYKMAVVAFKLLKKAA